MTYDFNAADLATSDLLNPFALENRLLFAAAAVFALGGVYALLTARAFLAVHADGTAISAAIAALLMLAVAGKLLIQVLTQLRFLFGRGFPVGLAPELKHDQHGTSPAAAELQHHLRERVIPFKEPAGPVAGLLYSLFRSLPSAPMAIQSAAQSHFEALITMAAVLFSMGMSYVLFSGSAYEGVVSWLYLPLTGLSLLKPWLWFDDDAMSEESRFVLLRVLALVVFALMGPVLIPRFVPAVDIAPMWAAPFWLLVGSLGASSLFFAAILSRIDNVSQTAVSCEQATIAMNCQPAQLLTAISRDFQEAWVRDIPNRKYVSIPPDAGLSKGSFNGSVLEETQPVSTNMLAVAKFFDALKHPESKALVFLGLWGVLMAFGAAVVVFMKIPAFGELSRMEMSQTLLTIIAFVTSTLLSFRIGHLLWSRMYFKSRLTWIDVNGTYQTAELDVGNTVTGNARSRSTVIRVEDATLRVWCSDITTIAFGKTGKRSIIAMAPADSAAASIARRLQEFAASQSMIVAPTSSRDFDKTKVLSGLGQVMRSEKALSSENLASAVATLQSNEEQSRTGGGQLIEASVKFYDAAKDFGYLRTEEGAELRFTSASFTAGVTQLTVGDRILFAATEHGSTRQVQEIHKM